MSARSQRAARPGKIYVARAPGMIPTALRLCGALWPMVPKRFRPAIAVVLIVAIGLAVGVGWRWWHNRAPYDASALAVSVTLDLVTYDAAKAALGEAASAPFPQPGDQLILGRVTWLTPPSPLDGGWFTIVLVDKRTHLKPAVFSVSSARQNAVGVGSDGVLNQVEQKYPWLRGAGATHIGDNWWDNGDTVFVYDATASPVTFVALFLAERQPAPPLGLRRATAPVTVSDLLAAIVYIGPDRQVYWAQRLAG